MSRATCCLSLASPRDCLFSKGLSRVSGLFSWLGMPPLPQDAATKDQCREDSVPPSGHKKNR